jgi:AcrR family transcriptional regulator
MHEIDTATRPLRADARRNREKIVAAARAAFAEYGLDVQMDEIARRAEVGVGTLYRHFPTKDAMVRAIVVAHMEGMAARGREVLERDDADPWEAFAGFMRLAGEQHLADRGLSQVMSTQPAQTFQQAARDSGLIDTVEQLLQRAQQAGRARTDARVQDVPLVMCAVGAVLGSWGKPEARRFMELILDGIGACDAPALPPAEPGA